MTSSVTTPGDSDDFYDSNPLEPDQLYQGEILTGVPLLTMPRPGCWQLLRTKSGKRLDDALERGRLGGTIKVLDSNQSREEWQTDGNGDFAIAVLDKRPAIVLSQTCDIQTKPLIQVAPIFPAEGTPESIEKLRKGDRYSAFWLPRRVPDLPVEGYADFVFMQSVHRSYVTRIRPEQHFRLKPEHSRALQRHITRYFGRPNSFDAHSDLAPKAGTYLCVRCFYFDARISFEEIAEGAAFEVCQVCQGKQWILKGA